ncbi:hypothetical protein B0H14DRAFT_3709426 [Mycena olivaceomarginata]|nr:hypothetical protein B0H14DRAFT_3709426 [Mycena olivaceomarginata]
MPDIHATRTALRCPASHKFPDGSDYHTLLMLQDTTPGAEFILGDSLDIACYLTAARSSPWTARATGSTIPRRTFTTPWAPCVKPPLRTSLTTRTSIHMSTRRSPPRGGVPTWDDLIGAFADAEKRAGIFRAFDTRIAGLARLYAQMEGPFLEGQMPSYADLVVEELWSVLGAGGVGRILHLARRRVWEIA